jgi:hypothetical protein
VILQWFLRGVHDDDGSLDDNWAKRVLDTEGLRSAWLRAHPGSDPADWDQAVNPADSLLWHITRFDQFGFPAWPNHRYGDLSPFLSLSSGTVEPDHQKGRNQQYPAWYTAVKFATDGGYGNGWVFHGYASILGRPSLPLLEFSEEVRDLHQHDFYNRYHPEGELAAKILVPPVRLKEAFRVTADKLREWMDQLENGKRPPIAGESPLELLSELSDTVLTGSSYRPPEEFSNIRDLR